MTNNSLISKPHDQRRSALADEIQDIQNALGHIQGQFADSTLAFAALLLAWESVRVAWYAVRHESDGQHLRDVHDALTWLHQQQG